MHHTPCGFPRLGFLFSRPGLFPSVVECAEGLSNDVRNTSISEKELTLHISSLEVGLNDGDRSDDRASTLLII